jgi:RNA polymerase sigma-70 factor (ECF subfamily)
VDDTNSQEALLLRRAGKGDPRAFELLVEPHLAGLRRFTRAFARGTSDADDLAQEALLKAFRNFHQYEARSPLSHWLFTVARSVCHDWYRRNKSRARFQGGELNDSHAYEGRSPEQELVARNESERLWAAIGHLDDSYRVPIVLFDIEGLSYQDIAEIEQIPVGTVRSRLARGRQRLYELLDGDIRDSTASDRSEGTSEDLRTSVPVRSDR